MTGETISHYRILEKLGEGGMGVVWKARDTHLDRLVAIKVLPPERVADPERRLRFVQEAKAASALNHPNILHIYDIDQAAGVDFIAMEYVPGKTLDQWIGRKGLALSEALRYAVQIADALDKAHAAGIVHRDIKPGNIMVTGEGLVKLLDFGLAKLTEPIESDELGPTETLKPVTEEGTIVGTVAYMSPEQAEGKKVDARSDIFSFGLVLYEMVTGRRAFQGETKLSILSAILHKDPPAVSELAGDVPRDLEKIIARCLRKDPERRIQHMIDVKLALEDLKEESDSGKLLAAAAPRRRRRVVPWAISGLMVVVLAAASVALWLMRRPKPLGAPLLMQLTTDTGLTTDPALSPDGRLLAYASDRSGKGNLDIWVRQIGGGEPIPLTQDPADEREPTFSPDGTIIAFRSEREGGGIYVVSALGGPPRKIASEGRRPRFSPDGSQIAYWSGAIGGGAAFSTRNYCRIFVVASAGGGPRQVRPDFVGAAYPEWAPDGKHLLFLGNSDEKLPVDENTDWWVTPLDQGPAIATGAFRATRKEGLSGPLLVYPWALIAPVWETRGDSLIFSARSGDSSNLWRIGISSKTWKVTGLPQRLTSSPTIEENPSIALVADGSVKIAFASLTENSDIWSLPLEANTGRVTGDLRQLTQDSAADFHPSLSADGRKMVWVSARSGNQEIWIKDLNTGEDAALTASRMDKYNPHFSADGRKVSFAAHREGKWDIYLVPATGGAAEMICEDCGQATGWSPDGKYLIGNSVGGRLYLVEVASRRRIDLVALSGRWFAGGTFSPDGRWITFLEVGLPPREHIAPFQGETSAPEKDWVSILNELDEWSPDGSLVYGVSDHDGFNCIWAQRVDRATKRPVGSPLPIFHSHGARRTVFSGISLGREKMVFDMTERTGNIWMAQSKGRW
jgi:Tol biopolymer transport system component/predicted Ser/Thr protein kinase